MYQTKSAFFPLRKLVILATASLCSLGISPKAEALTSLGSYTDSFTNQITELDGTPVLTLPRYNGSDTLQQVVFTVNATLTSSGTVTNIAPSAQTFTVRSFPIQYDLNLNASPDSPAALSNLVNPNTGGTFSPFSDSNVTIIGSQKYTSLASNASSSFGSFTVNGSSSQTFTNAADVQGFVGSGTYSFAPFSGIATAISGGGGNVNSNISTFASTSIQVEYFGTAAAPVPFGFSTNASLVVFGGMFYGFHKIRKNMAVKKSQA